MSQQSRKQCPRCRKHLVVPFAHTGSPICVCSTCGKEYYDKDIREAAFYDAPKWETNGRQLLFSFLLFGLPTVFFLVVAINLGHIGAFVMPFVPFCFYVWLLWVDFRKMHRSYQKKKRLYEASLQRLQDPGYVARLIRYGYCVPRHYLAAHYPQLLDAKADSNLRSNDGRIFYFPDPDHTTHRLYP